MPATFTRHPVETERKDTGIGGKPPVDRRPTGGGGDGDNWENRPPGRRGPRELLNRYRLGSPLRPRRRPHVLRRPGQRLLRAPERPATSTPRDNYISDWHPLAVPPILWLNTAILMLSSLTMEIARRQLFREIDVMEEWLGLGTPRRPPRRPLAGRDRRPRHRSSSPANGSPGSSSSSRASSSLAQSQQPLLLPHHRNPRLPPGARRLRPRLRSRRMFILQAASNSARSPSTAPPGTGTPWASSGSSSSACSPSSSEKMLSS